ncbi:MAG: hypothetical protein QOK37_3626 [Thermoanaerobaculia bacterium]|jgi:hypothetical protein|nr:hypothetical protein [Thermoanaerobaculia bacterium]
MNDARIDRLYALLPGVYQKRDAEYGQPLRALLRVIAEQAGVVERDIAQLYENWFIETCEEWMVPYIAELAGYHPVHEGGDPGSPATAEGAARNRILIPRAHVAHTIRDRRRKGTLAILESMSRDVAGWPARAVEFYRLLAVAQNLNHLQPARGRFADLRDADALDRIDGPFDEVAHTVDVRRRYNIPSAGLFVWPMGEYSVTHAPAYHLERRARKRGRNRFTFTVLGNDTELCTLPVEEPESTHIADELNVPTAIRLRAFDERTADYYGDGKSLMIWVDDHAVALERIVAADLSGWTYSPKGDQVAVDPRRGRIVLADDHPAKDVRVSYHYAFSADIGGGEYERALSPSAGRTVYTVSQDGSAKFKTINAALDAWQHEQEKHPDVIIEIGDSAAYTEGIEIELKAGQKLELRARNGARPVVRLMDEKTSGGDAIVVSGPTAEDPSAHDPRFILDGLLITGQGLQIQNRLSCVVIRHCTLVPGWTLGHDCQPEHEEEPSIELLGTTARVNIEHSIVGSILVDENEVLTDPLRVSITDSIVDATREDLDAIGVSGSGRAFAHVMLTIARCTVIGEVNVHAIELAENCIFHGRVKVARSQTGCMRFCYVPDCSRTPRRYDCQPDAAMAAVKSGRARRHAERRVRPRFESLRYGVPFYCRLHATTAPEIARGADDESAMGVFHDRFEPQREANLRVRLDEFTPAGIRSAVIPSY